MKKVLFGLVILFIGTQMMTSCSSESNVLSQFSKRKYMKRFKSKDIKQKDVINERTLNLEYASVEQPKEEIEVYAAVESQPKQVVVSEKKTEGFVSKKVELSEEKKADLEMFKAAVNDYSTNYISPIDMLTVNNSMVSNFEKNNKNLASSQVNEVVLAILCIFIPPLAVFLYEDSITTNFWIDLIATLFFWLPGIILAFLIVFAGVSF